MEEIVNGVPQCFFLGHIFFIIHMSDLFYLIEKWGTTKYADDTTPRTAARTVVDVIISLKKCATILFKWFNDNFMETNSDNSHLLLSTDSFSSKF